MSSNYGYGYDATYAAYAGYAAAQYNILQQQQQQQLTTSTQQVGYGHVGNTANTTGYGLYQQSSVPNSVGATPTNQQTKSQSTTPSLSQPSSTTNQSQYSYVSLFFVIIHYNYFDLFFSHRQVTNLAIKPMLLLLHTERPPHPTLLIHLLIKPHPLPHQQRLIQQRLKVKQDTARQDIRLGTRPVIKPRLGIRPGIRLLRPGIRLLRLGISLPRPGIRLHRLDTRLRPATRLLRLGIRLKQHLILKLFPILRQARTSMGLILKQPPKLLVQLVT